MTAARQRGAKISFDCNFRARVWGSRAQEAPAVLRRLCEQADLIFGDERDFAFMLGGTADAAFEAFEHLQFIACTSRARQSADVQQLSGLCRAGGTPTRPAPTLSTESSIASARAMHSRPASCTA